MQKPNRRAATLHIAAATTTTGTTTWLSGCASPPEPTVQARRVEITVSVPAETPTLYVTGNLTQLGPWRPNALALGGSAAQRRIVLDVPAGHRFEYKFTLGSWDREALGPSGMVMGNFVLSANETQVSHTITDFKRDTTHYLRNLQGSGILGRLVVWESVASPLLREKRHVTVWLPPEYDASPSQSFQVVYAHDGQNLFDPRIANTGIDWGVDESIVRLRTAGSIGPTIVVGLWSTADRRLEYSPDSVIDRLDPATRQSVREEFKGALLGNAYLRYIATEVKPKVDAEFRTRPQAQYTTLMGASMGGLISLYGLTQMPQVFGRAAALSVHWPASISRERIFVNASTWQPLVTQAWKEQLEALPEGTPRSQRLWVDRGGVDLDALYAPYQRELVPVLEQAGYRAPSFAHRVYPSAAHNEAAWRSRLDEVLAFVLA